MTAGDLRANAVKNPSNSKGIEFYTPDQDEPERLEPGLRLTGEHLARFAQWEKDALLEKKAGGWESPIRASGQGFEWDHFEVSMTEGMTKYFQDPSKEEELYRYRQAIIEGLREVPVDKGGQVIDARKCMFAGDWHKDTDNTHFDVYLHRFPIAVENKYIAPAERVTTDDERTPMQTRLNAALERHGFSKDFFVEIESGLKVSKAKSAERTQEKDQKIAESWVQKEPESAHEPQAVQEDPRKVIDELIKAEGGEPMQSPTAKPLSEITPDALRFTQTADQKFEEAASYREQIQALELKERAATAQGVSLQHAAAVHIQNDALKAENGQLKDNVEALKIEKGEVLDELNATKEELAEVKANYAELNEIATEQAKELEGAYGQVEALTQTVQVQAQDIEALTADKASLAGQLNKTEHKLGVANSFIRDLQGMVNEAEEQRDAQREIAQRHWNDLHDTRTILKAREAEIGQLKTELGATRDLVQEQEKAIGQAKNELSQAQTELGQVKGQVQELRDENWRLKDGMSDMRLELTGAKAQAENLAARLTAAEQANGLMKDNLDAQKGLVAAQAEALAGKDKHIADLEARLAAMEARMQEQPAQEQQQRPEASKALHEVLSARLQGEVVAKVTEPDYPSLAGKDKNGNDVWLVRNKETQITAYAVTGAKTGEIKEIQGEASAQRLIKGELETRNRDLEPERKAEREREGRDDGMER